MSNKPTKRALVPKLRFPEFRDVGGWEVESLGEQISLEYGASLPESQRNGGRFPVLGSNGVVGYHDDYLIEGPAIVIGRKGSVGQINWIESNCYPIDTTYYVRNKHPDRASLNFIKLALENCQLTELKDPSAVPGLNRDRVHSARTAFPLPAEQQKIADCLASIDELITAQAQKLDTLKAHKKGLMQQLFPAEGETLPKLRFPEFREAAQWSIKQLKQVCAVNPATSELPEIFAYIDLESVEAGELKVKKIISREESPSRAQRLLNYGDVIFQIVRPYQRNNFYFKIHDDIKYVASTGYAQLRAFESKDFLFQVIHTDDFVEKVIAKCTGSSYPAINSSDLAEIAVAIPKPAEQQKIGDCLTSVDDLITAQTKKLEGLKSHKKGLMQQLFPAFLEADV